MKILGISPLDKDATASIVEDGHVLFAAGEERFNRVKQTSGFPTQALEAALRATNTNPDQIDVVAYPFLDAKKEADLISNAIADEQEERGEFGRFDLERMLDEAEARIPQRHGDVHGLSSPNERMYKGLVKETFYRVAALHPTIARDVAMRESKKWAERATLDHQHWQQELEAGLARYGLAGKLKRGEHHISHAANAYLTSGFDRALIVTLDGYGSGLAGSVSIGENGKIHRLHGVRFPHSLGTMYEAVTSSLGMQPDRHAGKVVGLAAYGDPDVLTEVLLARVHREGGTFKLLDNLNVFFSRHLSTRFPKVDLAAAYQRVLEIVAVEFIEHWLAQTGCRNVVLSGGVAANVKLNQRIHTMAGVDGTFVYPNMGDGGCGTGLAMLWSWKGGPRASIHDVYWGPNYSASEIREALDAAGLRYEQPRNLPADLATRIHKGEVVARFDGRMEYGPRALGSRSILYHAREPEVNQWLNKRLGRTEFMPFAPVTLWEAREKCYHGLRGAEHTAEFMTMTFDCTPWMKEHCPAAVHVDGTARPQLIQREVNPGYYEIVKEYEKLSGIPCLINTSFNMHEEPIVCSPQDAVRAFLQGNLDVLAIGPFVVPNPKAGERGRGAGAREHEAVGARH